MSPRIYQSALREARLAEVRQRIAEAAAALHAEKGGLGTSFKEIAQRADVSLPTVYKHFPTLDALIPACTGHALSRAPQFDPEQMEAVEDLSERLLFLVKGIFAQHHYFHPWLKWGETEHIPALKPFHQGSQDHLRDLIERALAPCFRKRAPPSLLTIAEALLGYGAWQILHLRLPPLQAQGAVHQSLLTLIHAHSGAHSGDLP